MKLHQLKSYVATLIIGLGLQATSHAGGEFRFQLGLTYTSGFTEVIDAMEDVDDRLSDNFVLPVGLSLNPYYEFDFGLGIGANIGPTSLIFVDTGWETDLNIIVPVGLDLRYTFLRDKNVSPYVRAGFRYPIVSGDYFDSSTPGFFGAVGVEFLRTKRTQFGLEVAYDTSEVTVEGPDYPYSKDVQPYQFMVSLFVTF